MQTAAKKAAEGPWQTGISDFPEGRIRGFEQQSGDGQGAESAGPENAVKPAPDSTDGQFHPDEIRFLAYRCWEERGCPDGSPEEDWFRAESALREALERR